MAPVSALSASHGPAPRGTPQAALPRGPGARRRGILREDHRPHGQGAAQSGRGEAKRQPGRPLQRGPAMSPAPPLSTCPAPFSSGHSSPRLLLLLLNRLDGFEAQATILSIFVCKNLIM